MERNYVAFSTGMFRSEQPDAEINQWFLGEDCAKWLQSRLVAVEGISFGVAPEEEDWGGWEFGIRVEEVWFWVQIWGSLAPSWVVGIEPSLLSRVLRRKRTELAKAKLRDAVDAILTATTEITRQGWMKEFGGSLDSLSPDS